jgi:protein-S-isoprenylcysteine O-methyltransferase Ste14
MANIPTIIVVATVWMYWLSVLIMIVRSHLLHRTQSGTVPRMGRERWMWLLWVPTVLAWQVVPALAHMTSWPFIQVPQWAIYVAHPLLQWIAAGAALASYALTVPCWLALGDNWSLAVVPGKKSTLITRGLYRRMRHPIYSLGLLLMLATVAVSPSPAMVVVAVSHLTLVMLKCRSEESFLKSRHGQKYDEYCAETGRLFPRFRTQSRAETTEWRDAA